MTQFDKQAKIIYSIKVNKKRNINLVTNPSRGRAAAAREAHNLEDAGSNPAPATDILELKAWNLELGTWNLKPKAWKLELKIYITNV